MRIKRRSASIDKYWDRILRSFFGVFFFVALLSCVSVSWAATAPNADASLFKAVQVHERFNVQFRAEAFNATNTPQLGGPSTSLTSTSAGVVSMTQSNDPRNIQLSLRVRF